jgi:putative phosphoesterase
MKIAVITDAHANLPALEAALHAIRAEDCDLIVHVGDAIAIGPHPAECVDLMQNTPNLKCVMGNHDLYYVKGLPQPQPERMSAGEAQHQLWTHRQLGEQRRAIISQWPMMLEEHIDEWETVFLHYGLSAEGNDFMRVVHSPGRDDLDRIFGEQKERIIFFGHDHAPSDMQGRARYVNPGSLGCCPISAARYTIARYEDGQVNIQHYSVAYDDRDLFGAFESRNVPEREFIYKTFFGGRFGA